jgi:hypothetical protein
MDLYYVYLDWYWVVLFLLALPYVVLPLIAKFHLRFNGDPLLGVLDPASVPEHVAAWMFDKSPALQGAGFTLATIFTEADRLPGSYAFHALWTNRQAGDVAILTFVGRDGLPRMPGRKRPRYVEFVTAFANGVTVTTGNRADLPLTTDVPTQHEMHVPDVIGPGVLYRLHQARVARLAPPGARRSVPGRGFELVWFRNVVSMTTNAQADAGWLRQVGRGETYVPTWKASVRMTWGQIPPGRWIRAWRRREAGERELDHVRRQEAQQYATVK